MTVLALLVTALLFGGMVLYSFGFAAFLFNALQPDEAGRLLRRACPHFYLFVLGASALAAALRFPGDLIGAALLAAVAVTVIPARQVLMPAINAASDAGDKRRFGLLYGGSVMLTLTHIALSAWALARFI
ncbi:DUF4149 domain-containing protein [Thalassococcus profundi]|uniref:DUF4149 domain-containing protein n=1 Tax=Thalassococcus profundi TaxID=2282382 RepID=A0A369TQA6_9RHOB|nr:DUF4149 domain-containing protein [Thalassococcus profundi]RDD67350.1 DUF4149 domain-containing protein [Thalassococcus profundi]